MKQHLYPKIMILPFLAVFAFFISCSGQVNTTLRADHSATVEIDASLGPNSARLFSPLGGNQSGPVLNAVDINRSLLQVQGINSSNLRNSGNERIQGTIGISNLNTLISANRGHNFIE